MTTTPTRIIEFLIGRDANGEMQIDSVSTVRDLVTGSGAVSRITLVSQSGDETSQDLTRDDLVKLRDVATLALSAHPADPSPTAADGYLDHYIPVS